MADRIVQLKDQNDNNIYPVPPFGLPVPVTTGGTGADNAVDAVQNLGLGVETITPTITGSSVTITNVVCFRQGQVVFLSFDAKPTIQLSANGGTATFSVTGIPSVPCSYLRSRSIASTLQCEAYIASDGSGGIRNMGSSAISANTTFYSFNFMWITAN